MARVDDETPRSGRAAPSAPTVAEPTAQAGAGRLLNSSGPSRADAEAGVEPPEKTLHSKDSARRHRLERLVRTSKKKTREMFSGPPPAPAWLPPTPPAARRADEPDGAARAAGSRPRVRARPGPPPDDLDLEGPERSSAAPTRVRPTARRRSPEGSRTTQQWSPAVRARAARCRGRGGGAHAPRSSTNRSRIRRRTYPPLVLISSPPRNWRWTLKLRSAPSRAESVFSRSQTNDRAAARSLLNF